MPFSLVCYNGHPLTVGDEYAGRKVVCPVCQLTVPVPNPPRAAPASGRNVPSGDGNGVARQPLAVADDEDEPPRTLGPAAAPVNAGLAFHAGRLLLYPLSMFALIVVLILTVAEILEQEVLITTLEMVVLCGLFVQPGLGIAGCALCLGAPAESKSRRFILASLVLDLATAAAGAVLLFAKKPPETVALLPAVEFAALLPIFSWAFLMLFLWRLAWYLDQPDHAHDALVLLLKGAGLTVVGVLFRLAWFFYWSEIRPELIPDAVLIFDVALYLVTITGLVFLLQVILSNLEFIGTMRGLLRPTR
jgi:hypothetical protein